MSDEHLHDDQDLDQDNELDHEGSQGDDFKLKLAEDLGLDLEDEAQAQILEKVSQREAKQREITSKAILQKKKYREQLQQFQAKKGTTPQGNTQAGDVDIKELVRQEALNLIEERELKSLSLSEDLEEEVRMLAKLKNVSILEAARLPYIQSRKQEIDREARIQQATPSGKGRGKLTSNIDPDRPPIRGNYSPDAEGSKAFRQDMENYSKRQRERSQS